MSAAIAMLGGGEQARVIAEAATLSGLRVLGAIDDTSQAGLTHLGKDQDLADNQSLRDSCGWIIAIGNNASRQRVATHWAGRLRFISVVHHRAWISPSAHIGVGVFVGPGAIIHNGAIIGDHTIINSSSVIEHDAHIGDGVHIAPGAVLGGGVHIGSGVLVGIGARIRDHRSIGTAAVIGMGAVVISDVAGGVTMLGNPARERKS
ncbi:MAG: acetyltransferase [Planctomycetota bacterium]